MERITGIGGVFFKAKDAGALRRWYSETLGIEVDPVWGGAQLGDTVWSIFEGHSSYFDPSAQPFMINYRVADLDAMLLQLRAAGVQVDDRIDETEFGRFGWAMDPEGNRIELWEPLRRELLVEGQ
jgi:catechol 2,3-dioxygenase-like lactoylglutathione lyase family enzyme